MITSIVSKLASSDLGRTVMRRANRGLLIMRKYSPEIAMVAGTIMAIGTVVAVHKAAIKSQDILKEAKQDLSCIKECEENEELQTSGEYTQEDAVSDKTMVYTSTVINLAKLYAPAFFLGAGSLTMFYASAFTLKRRHAAAAAAFAAVSDELKTYRNRVIEELGSDMDKKFRFGLVSEKIKVQEVDPETGETREVETEASVIPQQADIFGMGYSKFARVFDETCEDYKRDPSMNLMFLTSVERYMNERLRIRGHVFLNEVYDAIGFPRTALGQRVGWVYNPADNTRDNWIDFGLRDVYKPSVRDFRNGYEPCVVLDFNVDGDILSLI